MQYCNALLLKLTFPNTDGGGCIGSLALLTGSLLRAGAPWRTRQSLARAHVAALTA